MKKSKKRVTQRDVVHETATSLSEDYHLTAIEELGRELYYYDPSPVGLWKPAEVWLRKKLEMEHAEYADERFIKAVMDKLRNRNPVKLLEIPKPPAHLIPLRTAVWDLEKNKPIEYSHEHFFFQKAGVDALNHIEFPTIQRFENQLFGQDEEKRRLFRKILAYTLCNGYPIKKSFIFYGPGDCGKSKAVELAEHIVGKENRTNISLQDLLQNRFAKARLFNKKLNAFADLPPSVVKNPGEFKVLTGGDNLGAEKKGKDGFDFKNEAKFIFSCNQIPEVDPDEVDITFFFRWEFLDFDNVIPVENQDPEIITKMLPELDGYAYVLIQELSLLLKEKKFSDKTPEDCQEVWMSHSVSAPQFVQECVESDPGNQIEQTFLGEKYAEFCKERNLPLQSVIVLGKVMRTVNGCFLGSTSRRDGDKVVSFKVWRNVRFKESSNNVATIPTTSLLSKENKESKSNVSIELQKVDGTVNTSNSGLRVEQEWVE